MLLPMIILPMLRPMLPLRRHLLPHQHQQILDGLHRGLGRLALLPPRGLLQHVPVLQFPLLQSVLLDDADGSLSENGLREDMDARVLDAALDTEDGIIVVVQL